MDELYRTSKAGRPPNHLDGGLGLDVAEPVRAWADPGDHQTRSVVPYNNQVSGVGVSHLRKNALLCGLPGPAELEQDFRGTDPRQTYLDGQWATGVVSAVLLSLFLRVAAGPAEHDDQPPARDTESGPSPFPHPRHFSASHAGFRCAGTTTDSDGRTSSRPVTSGRSPVRPSRSGKSLLSGYRSR